MQQVAEGDLHPGWAVNQLVQLGPLKSGPGTALRGCCPKTCKNPRTLGECRIDPRGTEACDTVQCRTRQRQKWTKAQCRARRELFGVNDMACPLELATALQDPNLRPREPLLHAESKCIKNPKLKRLPHKMTCEASGMYDFCSRRLSFWPSLRAWLGNKRCQPWIFSRFSGSVSASLSLNEVLP